MRKRRIIVSVISDLVSDQRVHRVCSFLQENDFNVLLIGRRSKKSLPLQERNYPVQRIRCFFNSGILKYAEFNFRLFFKILFKKSNLLLSNDLDTLVPNYIVSKIRSKKLFYDTHEFFTGMPELQDKPFKKRIWRKIEKFILPHLKNIYTVSDAVAGRYKKEYGISMKVVRNVPFLTSLPQPAVKNPFPEEKIILLLQGSGINKDRGAEELIQSMSLLPGNFFLVLIGGGERWEDLKALSDTLSLSNRIRFIEKVPFEELKQYTMHAHLGFSLDKPINLNYRLSLPNKVFDYIHAGIPVVASEITEVKRILETYEVGTTIPEVTADNIAAKVLEIFDSRLSYDKWKQNTAAAAKELCWQKEQTVLKRIFEET